MNVYCVWLPINGKCRVLCRQHGCLYSCGAYFLCAIIIPTNMYIRSYLIDFQSARAHCVYLQLRNCSDFIGWLSNMYLWCPFTLGIYDALIFLQNPRRFSDMEVDHVILLHIHYPLYQSVEYKLSIEITYYNFFSTPFMHDVYWALY